MGKIMVVGKVEREVFPDLCSINLEIETRGDTASEASRLSSEECERLLTCLVDLGIEPDSVELSYQTKSGLFQRGCSQLIQICLLYNRDDRF